MTAQLAGLVALVLALLGAAVWLVRQGRAAARAQSDAQSASEDLYAARLKELYADERARAADKAARDLAALNALPPGSPERADALRRLLVDGGRGPGAPPPAGGGPAA